MAGVLGEKVSAPRDYAPEVLEAIPRARGRDALPSSLVIHGSDIWHLYELSWLDSAQRPQHFVGVLEIAASSLATVESKSLKLYLNSLNFYPFASRDAAVATIKADIARIAQGDVALTLFAPTEVSGFTKEPEGMCLDGMNLSEGSEPPLLVWDGTLLADASASKPDLDTFFSHHLRSLCPVTGQPDWGTLWVHVDGGRVDPVRLLALIESFREHQDFHEQCVERIFAEIQHQVSPQDLTVAAFYQRRGGIDITPWRANHPVSVPPDRMARQ